MRPTRPARPVAALLIGLAAVPCVPHAARGQDDDDPPPLVRVGKFHVEEYGVFRRLLHENILWATQIHQPYLVRADSPIPFGVFSPWEVVLLEGSLAAWDPRQEPLTYYHRTGPVGAIFHHLRTRKGGADAKAPVGVIGLTGGTTACYALPGQKFTYYETDPALKKLVADTDRYFTHIADARARGAEVDFRIGNARKNLAADRDRKYGVLLVELYDTGFDPGERLTLEAVKLYADRVAAGGIVAIHVSNKYYRVPPVVAAIAKELGLAGRIWNDDYDGRPGKTASSWVVLAKDEADLGVLAKPTTEQVLAFGTKNLPLAALLRKYGPEALAKDAIEKEWGGTDLAVEDFMRRHGSEAATLLQTLRQGGAAGTKVTLGGLTELVYGPMFQPLETEEGIGVRRDSDKNWPFAATYAPVWLKKLFGVPEGRGVSPPP